MPDAFTSITTRDRMLMPAAVGGSLLVSGWQLLTNEVINRDGVRYVTAAEAISTGNLQGAFDAFPWPFHAALMAGLHKVTGWSFETCGYAMIPPLHLILVLAFLAVLRELGAARPVLWAGLALILLHPGLNDTLPGILRDQGYWACWMLSLLLFIRYYKHHRWRDAIGWTLCMVLALLFRIEGLVFLLLMPLVCIFNAPDRLPARLLSVARAYVPLLCLAITALFFSRFLGRDLLMLDEGRIAEPLQRAQELWSSVTQGIAQNGRELGEQLLPRYSRNHGPAAMWVVLGFIAVVESLRAVSMVYAGLACIAAFTRRYTPDPRMMPVIWWVIAINLILIVGFVLSEFYLSTRYAAGLALSMTLLASFALASLWLNDKQRAWGSTWGRALFPIAVAALVITGASGLISIGPRKHHELEAGQWLRENIPPATEIYFDDIRTAYYAGQPYIGGIGHDWPRVDSMLRSGRLDRYEVLVLHFGRRQDDRAEQAEKLIGFAPVQLFENNRGDRIAIFRRQPADE